MMLVKKLSSIKSLEIDNSMSWAFHKEPLLQDILLKHVIQNSQ